MADPGRRSPVFFGCWDEAGHYYWAPGMPYHHPNEREATPWGLSIDSSGWDHPGWRIEHLAGWTAVGRRDNTVDSRPGSIAVFCFPGDLTLDVALEQARTTFPQVWTRLFPADSQPGSNHRPAES